MISAFTPSVRIISSRTSGAAAATLAVSLAARLLGRDVGPAERAVVDHQAPAAVGLGLDPPGRPVAEVGVHPLEPQVVRLVDVGVGRDLRQLGGDHEDAPPHVPLGKQSIILTVDVHTLRRQDFSLSVEQQALRDAFAALFEKESPSARVRAAEPLGFDPDLWRTVLAAGAIGMGVPQDRGGDGADLVDLVLVAEQLGRRLGPVPLVEGVVAARLLAASDAPAPMIDAVTGGESTATVALHATAAGARQLVPAGAVADLVVGLEAGALVAVQGDERPAPVANTASAPFAWRTLTDPGGTRTVLAEGARAAALFAGAVLEWKLLMAAAQTGVGQGALDLAIEYANERRAFGVPIGTFQAISHSIVDVAIGVEGSRRLHRRAAWFADHEPGEATAQILMAFLYARDVANRAATTGIHVQGGFGFTLESDLQLYFRRAKGWTLASGDPYDDLRRARCRAVRTERLSRSRHAMDFSRIDLDDDRSAFWADEVRPFMDEHLPDDLLARERVEGNGFDPEYQRALARRGWLEPWLGADDAPSLDPVRAAIVRAEEYDRVGPLFPVAGSHSLVMGVVRQFGSDALRAEIEAGVSRGEIQACLGYTEPDCGSDAAAIRTRAVRDGDEWLITGQKMFSTGAHRCQYVMVTARTNPDVAKHQGITMFLVPLGIPGVEVRGIGTLGGERTNFVHLDDVRVPDSHRLGPVDQGWLIASGALAAEHGMDDAHGAAPVSAPSDADLLSALDATTGWMGVFGVALDAAVEWATHHGRARRRAGHRPSVGAGAARPRRARLGGRAGHAQSPPARDRLRAVHPRRRRPGRPRGRGRGHPRR